MIAGIASAHYGLNWLEGKCEITNYHVPLSRCYTGALERLSLASQATSGDRYHGHPHFIDEETVGQRGQVIYGWSPSWYKMKMEIDSCSSDHCLCKCPSVFYCSNRNTDPRSEFKKSGS